MFLALISICHDLHSAFSRAQNRPPTISLLFKALKISLISFKVAFFVNLYSFLQNC